MDNLKLESQCSFFQFLEAWVTDVAQVTVVQDSSQRIVVGGQREVWVAQSIHPTFFESIRCSQAFPFAGAVPGLGIIGCL